MARKAADAPIEQVNNPEIQEVKTKAQKAPKQERLSNSEIADLTKDLAERVEREYNLRKREGMQIIDGKKINHMDLEPTMLMLRRSYNILYALTGRQSRIA